MILFTKIHIITHPTYGNAYINDAADAEIVKSIIDGKGGNRGLVLDTVEDDGRNIDGQKKHFALFFDIDSEPDMDPSIEIGWADPRWIFFMKHEREEEDTFKFARQVWIDTTQPNYGDWPSTHMSAIAQRMDWELERVRQAAFALSAEGHVKLKDGHVKPSASLSDYVFPPAERNPEATKSGVFSQHAR